MSEPDLVEAIENLAENSPEGLALLITMACNELWGAIDEGRADMNLLVQVRDHVHGLIYAGPGGSRQ
jgi:hypothetical protein